MRRTVWSRVMALFVGLWFVAVSAGPELTHACPMHGSHAAAATLRVSHSGHGAATTQIVASDHRETSTPDSESASHPGAQCTCLGQCCGTAPVGTVSASIELLESETVASRDAGLPDYAYVPVAAQHVLPLATAPPLSA